MRTHQCCTQPALAVKSQPSSRGMASPIARGFCAFDQYYFALMQSKNGRARRLHFLLINSLRDSRHAPCRAIGNCDPRFCTFTSQVCRLTFLLLPQREEKSTSRCCGAALKGRWRCQSKIASPDAPPPERHLRPLTLRPRRQAPRTRSYRSAHSAAPASAAPAGSARSS